MSLSAASDSAMFTVTTPILNFSISSVSLHITLLKGLKRVPTSAMSRLRKFFTMHTTERNCCNPFVKAESVS